MKMITKEQRREMACALLRARGLEQYAQFPCVLAAAVREIVTAEGKRRQLLATLKVCPGVDPGQN